MPLTHAGSQMITTFTARLARRVRGLYSGSVDPLGEPHMRLNAGNTLVAAFGVALLLIVVTGAFSWSSTVNLTDSSRMMDQTHEVLENLEKIVSQLKDAETGQRGFVLTGEPHYLEPYTAGLAGLELTVEEVRKLTSDNPSQQRRLDVIVSLIQLKLEELSQTIDLRRDAGFDSALEVVLTDVGIHLMDELRAVIAEMEQEEIRLLEQRAAATAATATKTKIAVVFGIIVSTAIFGSIALFLSKTNSRLAYEVKERKRAEEAERSWAEESSAMAEIGRRVSGSLDINEVYDRLGEEIQKLIPFDRVIINLIDQEGESISQPWFLGTEVPGPQLGARILLAGTFAEEAIRTTSAVIFKADKESDVSERFPALLANFHAGMRSFLAAPLIYRDEVIGVLQVRSKERGVYSQRHLNLAERVGNQIAGAIANFELYAERQQAEEALRDSEERFRQMAENMREVFFLLDYKSQSLLYVNRAFEELWGRSRKSWYEQPSVWLDAIHPEDLELVNEALESQQTTGEYDQEYRIIRPDRSIRWVHDTVVPIKDELGQISRLVGIAEDVTERRQSEEKVKDSLQEKEVLLKEINHRVKNNLQIISSLLNLQNRDIQDEQALRSLQVSQDRIKAMALVHEKLYQSEDLARIDFGEYIKSLATDMVSSYGLGLRNIDLKIDVDTILLGVDTAIPCGVIVNELVANSLKHAFPVDRSGEIAISFREVDGQYMMTFKDDGVGLPEDLDISHPSSLGLTIVNALTGQLGGTIDLGRNGGSEIQITFPAAKGD